MKPHQTVIMKNVRFRPELEGKEAMLESIDGERAVVRYNGNLLSLFRVNVVDPKEHAKPEPRPRSKSKKAAIDSKDKMIQHMAEENAFNEGAATDPRDREIQRLKIKLESKDKEIAVLKKSLEEKSQMGEGLL